MADPLWFVLIDCSGSILDRAVCGSGPQRLVPVAVLMLDCCVGLEDMWIFAICLLRGDVPINCSPCDLKFNPARQMSASETNYNKIIAQFRAFNFNEDSLIDVQGLKETLDRISAKNSDYRYFDPAVAEELWDECQKENSEQVKVRTFASVIVRAQSILRDNIQSAERELSGGIADEDHRREMEESLSQFQEDLKILCAPFKIESGAESRYSQRVGAGNNASMSNASYQPANQSGIENSGFFSGRSSGIFAEMPSKRQDSTWLKFTFILAVVFFLVQILISFNKASFFNLLVYLSIFAIVLLGYFDKYYMRLVIGLLIVSLIFDFFWMVLLAPYLLNPTPPTTHSTLQTGFIIMIFILVIILFIGKIVLVVLLFRYTKNEENDRKVVILFGNNFQIDGRVKDNNPISRMIAGKGIFNSATY